MTTLFISHSSKQKAWAEEIRDALSNNGYQSLFLDSHPEDGIPAGVDWEQDLWQKLRQSRGLVVLCTADWLRSPSLLPARLTEWIAVRVGPPAAARAMRFHRSGISAI